MKKWKQALALVLALVMALSLVALPSFAEGEETGGGTAATEGSTNTPGLELRKVYNPSTGLHRLHHHHHVHGTRGHHPGPGRVRLHG
mgnify:CR=1 FL=1